MIRVPALAAGILLVLALTGGRAAPPASAMAQAQAEAEVAVAGHAVRMNAVQQAAPADLRWGTDPRQPGQLNLFENSVHVGSLRLSDGEYMRVSAGGWEPAELPIDVPMTLLRQVQTYAPPQTVPFGNGAVTSPATTVPNAETSFSARPESAPSPGPTGTFVPIAGTRGITRTNNVWQVCRT